MGNILKTVAVVSALVILALVGVQGPDSLAQAAGSFKMGVVDPQAVLERSRAGKRALANMKEYARARQKILSGDENELKNLERELQDQNISLAEEERREKQVQFREKVQVYQKRVQEFNQDIAAKQKELVDEYMEKISAATKTVAEKHGLALVVDKGSANTMKIVIYNRKSVDVTDQVIREFDRRYK